jgi:hypothetical protein
MGDIRITHRHDSNDLQYCWSGWRSYLKPPCKKIRSYVNYAHHAHSSESADHIYPIDADKVNHGDHHGNAVQYVKYEPVSKTNLCRYIGQIRRKERCWWD